MSVCTYMYMYVYIIYIYNEIDINRRFGEKKTTPLLHLVLFDAKS